MGNKSKINLIGYKGYKVYALSSSYFKELEPYLQALKSLKADQGTYVNMPKSFSEAIKKSFSDTPNKRIKLK